MLLWALPLHLFLLLPKSPTRRLRRKRWVRESLTFFEMFFEVFNRVAHHSSALGCGNLTVCGNWLCVELASDFRQKRFEGIEFSLYPCSIDSSVHTRTILERPPNANTENGEKKIFSGSLSQKK